LPGKSRASELALRDQGSSRHDATIPTRRAPLHPNDALSSLEVAAIRSRMEKLQYSVEINAPVHQVWTTMLNDETYRQWTSAFEEGSYFEGSWDEGSDIRFYGPDDDGSFGGLVAKVVENRPDEFVSVEYVGQIVDGVEDTTSDEAKQIIGAHENYTFTESDGVTTVTIDLDSDEEWVEMFQEAWPKALSKLKELAEAPR
jgi:uncharacterized protein YndB with AHSA1/START domain